MYACMVYKYIFIMEIDFHHCGGKDASQCPVCRLDNQILQILQAR
jgi:hypothetical protein